MKRVRMKTLPAAWRRIARVFQALGDEHRQRMLLMFKPGERLNIAQVVEASALSRTAVTHHLRVLREAGILHRQKVGKEVFFWPDVGSVQIALTAVQDYLD